MIYVLSTCTVSMGKEREFETTVQEMTAVYEKHGAKLVGLWWTLGGERNEVVWLFSWNDLKAYKQGRDAVWKDENFPIDKVASLVITFSDKLLTPITSSPLK